MLESENTASDSAPVTDIARFWPLDTLRPDDLSTVLRHTSVSRHKVGSIVLKAGSDDEYSWYLDRGTVGLRSGDKPAAVVESDSNLGRFPISNLRPHRYSVTALSEVTLLRMDQAVLREVINKDDNLLYHVGIPLSPAELAEDPLCVEIRRDFEKGQVPIPSLPNVVVQVYRVINDEDADARKIARVIQADPALTAKLLRTANSPAYRRARSVESCTEAVVRLGPPAVRNLVTSFVVKELFQSRVPRIQHYVKMLWEHSVMVAAISFNLAQMTPRMSPDTALLAGLLHDIGALCVLGYAERHPRVVEEGARLSGVIAAFRGPLGAETLRRWSLPDTIVNAALDAEDWHRDPAPTADYSDLVLISQLHHFASDPRMWSIPRIHEVPGYRKMASGRLSPGLSLEILDEAKQYIEETARWLMV